MLESVFFVVLYSQILAALGYITATFACYLRIIVTSTMVNLILSIGIRSFHTIEIITPSKMRVHPALSIWNNLMSAGLWALVDLIVFLGVVEFRKRDQLIRWERKGYRPLTNDEKEILGIISVREQDW